LYRTYCNVINFKEIDKKGGRLSLGLLERDVRKLWNARMVQNNVIKTTLQNIYEYLQDEDSVEKLLYLLPLNRGGLTCIGQALFSES